MCGASCRTRMAGSFRPRMPTASLPNWPSRPGPLKTEGAFYIWGQSEIEHVFAADSDVVRLRYGIEPGGNAPQDPHNEFTKKNLLYVARSIDDVARLSGRAEEDVNSVLDGARLRLFEARCARPRPHLDDKVLAGWNGLMLAGFARAARLIPADEGAAATWLETAVRAAEFLWHRLWDPERDRLLRRFRDGRSDIDGYCEDYACVVWGLLELFQAGGDPRWLDWARQLQTIQDVLFWDDEGGGWFSTTGDDPTVLLRLKEDYDGAEPLRWVGCGRESADVGSPLGWGGRGRTTWPASSGRFAAPSPPHRRRAWCR